MNDPLLIGIDVGTTSVKATLFDTSGRALKTWARAYPTSRPAPGIAEQDPDDWMAHVLSALSALSDGVTQGRIACVGLCAQANTHVFVDAASKPLLPAILWQDGRCGPEAADLDAQISAEEKIGWWGAPLPIDASHVLGRIAWVQRHHPELWARTASVLSPKDYCLLQLTGARVADPLTAFGMIDGSLNYVERLLALLPGVADRLPSPSPFTAMAGTIRKGHPLEGVPVTVGTMDAWAGVFGTGTLEPGDAMYLSGTSEILGLVSPERIPTSGVIAFPDYQGITLHAGPTQSGGASLAWLSALLGRSQQDLSALVAAMPAEDAYPFFLPHLQGERAPIWDIDARGVFAGLDSATGPAGMAKAVMEGVACSARLVLESLQQSGDRRPQIIRAAGGGMASDPWCQIRADMLGIPLQRMANLDAGVLGAAMLAGIGTGLFSTLLEAANHLVVPDRLFTPDPSRRAVSDDRFARHQDLYTRVKPFHAALAAGNARQA